MINDKPILMVVEDDEVDVEYLRRSLRARGEYFELDVYPEGTAALQALRGYSRSRRERLIVFLDINMPGMNGHEFLEAVRNDAELTDTTIFVLTTSDHQQDRAATRSQQVAGYFMKSDLDGLLDTVIEIAGGVAVNPETGS